jgi:hypothetical protein
VKVEVGGGGVREVRGGKNHGGLMGPENDFDFHIESDRKLLECLKQRSR